MHLKGVWRSAGMKFGEQCVMISGQVLMEPWLAGSWDFLQQVLYFLQEWNFKIVSSVLAQHICRVQFKFLCAGARVFFRAFFGQGTGDILLDNLLCNSRETRLVDCPHNGIGIHNCVHSEDAGLRCLRKLCISCIQIMLFKVRLLTNTLIPVSMFVYSWLSGRCNQTGGIWIQLLPGSS